MSDILTDRHKLYVNGVPVLYRAVTGAMENDANCYVGQFPGGILRLDGRLDNMMFYNICLTPAQVWSLWRYANVR